MTGFGSALKQERERNGLTLENLCEQTRVSLRHLQAVEAEEYATLPGGVFRKGIVRAYLQAVGLEEPTWMERFQASYDAYVHTTGITPAGDPDAWIEFAENVRANRPAKATGNGVRWMGVMGMGAGLVAVAWVVWTYVLRSHLG
jgi:cytoskeleton protein RodZ